MAVPGRLFIFFLLFNVARSCLRGSIICYKCNSFDSPNSCGRSNFDKVVHAEDIEVTNWNWYNHRSCVRRKYTLETGGPYYSRGTAFFYDRDGCDSEETCYCNKNYCNGQKKPSGSLFVSVTFALLVFRIRI